MQILIFILLSLLDLNNSFSGSRYINTQTFFPYRFSDSRPREKTIFIPFNHLHPLSNIQTFTFIYFASDIFATRKLREFPEFWEGLQKFMKTIILFWLIRECSCSWFFFFCLFVCFLTKICIFLTFLKIFSFRKRVTLIFCEEHYIWIKSFRHCFLSKILFEKALNFALIIRIRTHTKK